MTNSTAKLPRTSLSNPYCQPKDVGFRPSFHALWHLASLEVMKNLDKPEESPPWQNVAEVVEKDPSKARKIAIIDTLVNYKHPNLDGAIDEGLMRDFSIAQFGQFVVENPTKEKDRQSRYLLGERISGKNGPLIKAILAEIHGESQMGFGSIEGTTETEVFGSHGTAVAGLIGARPTMITIREPAYFQDSREPEKSSSTGEERVELPYCGINPFCQIIPIAISAVPDPEMLLRAVEYARIVEPDIVVVADSWDRPRADSDMGRVDKFHEESWSKSQQDDWEELEREFLKLSEETIVFCAAGNEALKEPVYPASLCQHSNGPWAVGACDDNKLSSDLSYSPDAGYIIDHGGWMIKTLSTEMSRYDREMTKIDPWATKDRDSGIPEGDDNFPPRDIVTTDLPGRAGYNPSPFDHNPVEGTEPKNSEHYEIGSLYTRFAGTSASTAIAAGLVSLIDPKKGKLDRIYPTDKKKDLPKNVKGKLNKLFDFSAAKSLFKGV